MAPSLKAFYRQDMKRHWRTIFFLSGLAAVILMLLTFDADWTRVKEVLSEAGIWFPVIVLLWGLIYLINACSFGLIINDGTGRRVPFLSMRLTAPIWAFPTRADLPRELSRRGRTWSFRARTRRFLPSRRPVSCIYAGIA